MGFGLNAAQVPSGLTYAALVKGAGRSQQTKGMGKAATWKGLGKAGGGGGPGGGKGLLHVEAPWYYAQPQNKQPEWQCSACGTSNRASRIACRGCWSPKPWASNRGKGSGSKGAALPGAPIGANGYGPMLGYRSPKCQGKAAKGGTTAATAPLHQNGKGGGKTGKASMPQSGNATGRGGTGFTEVSHAMGSRPKVQAPQADCGRTYPATKFHLLDEDEDEDAYAEQDAQGQMDEEEQQAARWDDADDDIGEQSEQQTGEEMLQAAKARLWMRQEVLRQFKTQFGKNHPQTRMAVADVEEALQRMREIRGPKQWHIRAREVERKAEAKERSIERRQAQIEQNRMWMEEFHQEFEAQQKILEEANDQEAREVKELWDQVESIKRESSYDEGRDQSGVGRHDDARKAVAELGQQLAAAQEEAAARGCEDLQQMLAAAGARVAQLEARAGGERAHEDDGMDDAYDDEDGAEVDGDAPPWRRNAGGGTAGRWNLATRRRGEGRGCAREAGTAAAAASTDGNGTGAAEVAEMDWATQGTERTRAPKRGLEGNAMDAMRCDAMRCDAMGDERECNGQSQQAREAQRRADEAAELAADAKREARRQRALDLLRGKVQVEKNAEIARRQQAAGYNVVECAQEWTPEQLEQSAKLIEQINKEFEARAEQKVAQMSEDELLRLLDEPGW